MLIAFYAMISNKNQNACEIVGPGWLNSMSSVSGQSEKLENLVNEGMKISPKTIWGFKEN